MISRLLPLLLGAALFAEAPRPRPGFEGVGVRFTSASASGSGKAEDRATGFEVKGWYGVLAPAGTPVKIIDFLNQTLRDVFADTALVDKLAKQGVELNGSSPEQATKFIADETEKWRKGIQEAGIKAN